MKLRSNSAWFSLRDLDRILPARFWQEKSARDLAECPKPGGESWTGVIWLIAVCLIFIHFCYIKRWIAKIFSNYTKIRFRSHDRKVCQSPFLRVTNSGLATWQKGKGQLNFNQRQSVLKPLAKCKVPQYDPQHQRLSSYSQRLPGQ